jgi:CheY-like chemotaxis protein
LINNAIKFTTEGYIEVGCYPIENGKMLEFYVKDTGIGIKAEHVDIIFQRFRKVEDDTSYLYRGAGLGLSISQQLVRMLGGSMRVESEYKKGSVFYFTIPLQKSTRLKPGQKVFEISGDIPMLENCAVLVAEDDFANYSYLEKLLQKTKARVLHAYNGKQVISLAISNPDIRLILMDIKMPEMNGIEAFRKLQKLNIQVPVIAQTAYAFSDEMRKIRAAGFTDYISKPINAKELYKMISKHIQKEIN